MLESWAGPKGILDEPEKYLIFGFNNPIPMGGSKLRGYEFWIAIPDDLALDDSVATKYFGGGFYAVISCKGASNIGKSWAKLGEWLQGEGSSKFKLGYPDDYDYANSPDLGMERHLNPGFDDINEMLIDCYMPIVLK